MTSSPSALETASTVSQPMVSPKPNTTTPWNTAAVNPSGTHALFGMARTAPHAIVLRFAVLNSIAGALLLAAWANGLLSMVMAADATRLSLLIFAVFGGGLVLCGWRISQVSRDVSSLNPARRRNDSIPARYYTALSTRNEKERGAITSSLRLELTQRIVLVRYIANSLVLLGLIGTVIGFIIALSGVDPEGAQDVAAIAPMVSTLIAGMSTALYTTLVGSVLNMWLMANYQILTHGTVKLISGLIVQPEPATV